MFSAHEEGPSFWGVLINADKSPAPLLEQLCLEIAHIIASFDDYGTNDLTPERLAAFYRKVGGNYDVLFLQTKPSALSFIYQRLGCFHSIQPTSDPYKPPAIPALQPNGFVRWQTIQLLLDPDEHCRYLQNAVELWDIENPNGGVFPKMIPREAFPDIPDLEMMEWHEEVSRRFELDYVKRNILRASPPNFGTYHYHFNHKDVPSPKEEKTATPRRRTTAHRAHMVPEEPDPHTRHRRRRSAEFTPSISRRVPSTHFSHPPDFEEPHRAPSPPMWAKPVPKARGRDRVPSFARPVSPGSFPGHSASDASSEDSSGAPRETSPTTDRHGRHLYPSTPQSHGRRHSHEAYARKPEREFSPENPRRYAHRDAYNPSSARPYDSDGARRARSSRFYADEPVHPRNPGPSYREHAFSDPSTVPINPEVPVYTHVHPRYMNMNNGYVVRPPPDIEMCGVDDNRRSYRPAPPSNPTGFGNPTTMPERTPYPSGGYRSQRWANPVQSSPVRGIPVGMPDMEYPLRTRRPTTMYDR
ncbi:hypothetical protein BO70DRAFT_318020 [Aspergillus heteromorphus CBS 117.55]|uniref:DUF7514 domain-containing protein n=1 Tax=Aspergillus heteromorphus CBS 117.55 TaxID=1448321 RepID=A0A317VU04_9EURO|nr:uncharacterized protein BO70DRAFT_318020 [Aspergillus heteromorphus CBS 117.55]PWY77069.1 hypothetical protein BO70DRAFT_318020 [Aspergillus heteromorphus CBS 117.55]